MRDARRGADLALPTSLASVDTTSAGHLSLLRLVFLGRMAYEQDFAVSGHDFDCRTPSLASINFAEFTSLLKNSLDARLHPRSGTKFAGFGAFQARFLVAIRLDTDFFNRLSPSTHSGA
jgi:hypothetical protein